GMLLESAMIMNVGRTPRTILVVDDDALVGRTLTRLLEPEARIHSVMSASHAARLLFELTFDGAILDVNIGADSGLDLLEHLRDRGADVPVSMLTGHLSPAVANRATELGAFTMAKPIHGGAI